MGKTLVLLKLNKAEISMKKTLNTTTNSYIKKIDTIINY